MTIKFHEQRLRTIRIATIAVGIGCLLCLALCVYLVGKPRPWHTDVGTSKITLVPEPALRIVSLAPSLTEIVFALGLTADSSRSVIPWTGATTQQNSSGEHPARLVGRTRYCLHPVQALKVPEVGGLGDPSIERLIGLHPDLILVTPMTSPEVREQLLAAGLKILLLKHAGVQGVLLDIQSVGDAVGKSEQAGLLVKNMRERLNAVRTKGEAGHHPRVLFLYDPDGLYSAGPGSFASELIALAGGENLANAATSSWPQLSMEFILGAKPDVIIVTGPDDGTDTAASTTERSRMQSDLLKKWTADVRWRDLEAVRQGHVVVIPSSPFTVPGPRMVDGAEQLLKAIASSYEATNKQP